MLPTLLGRAGRFLSPGTATVFREAEALIPSLENSGTAPLGRKGSPQSTENEIRGNSDPEAPDAEVVEGP